MRTVNFLEELERVNDYWLSRVVGVINDQYIKVANVKGACTWLKQDDIQDLQFGNEDAVHQMISQIAHKKGIGDFFAKGSLSAANKLGHKSTNYAVQVKGLELAGVEPRGSFGMALAYSTSDRGGCHQRCWTPGAELSGRLKRFTFEGVPKFVKESQDERAASH